MSNVTRRLFSATLLGAALAISAIQAPASAQEKSIVVASTTSTEQSGLFGHLLPIFTAKTGIQVKVVAQGTGQAIETARRGDADVLFVHDQKAEEKFVEEGFAAKRFPVMYNDFVLVGPAKDPAKVAGGKDVVVALQAVSKAGVPFASRGDDSGTHRAELRFWKAAEIDPKTAGGSWYKETGSGMGPTLNTAAGLGAYVLADRGTWLSFNNKGDLKVLVEGDKRLFNQYGVMAVSKEKHPHVKADLAKTFVDWVISPEGQKAIASYKIGGEQLFFPNAATS